ncbi:hypothetical protein KQX54_014284, partial [Cotesia glomerata]
TFAELIAAATEQEKLCRAPLATDESYMQGCAYCGGQKPSKGGKTPIHAVDESGSSGEGEMSKSDKSLSKKASKAKSSKSKTAQRT